VILTARADGIYRAAALSPDRVYRYQLLRRWGSLATTVGFVCLNPSTADAEVDDQTVRKCMRLARRLGASALMIGNLFAYRSTDPSRLRLVDDPVGPDNDRWLDHVVDASTLVIAAWGCRGALLGRAQAVTERYAGKLHALRLTRSGEPCHPLYLPENLTPFLVCAKGVTR